VIKSKYSFVPLCNKLEQRRKNLGMSLIHKSFVVRIQFSDEFCSRVGSHKVRLNCWLDHSPVPFTSCCFVNLSRKQPLPHIMKAKELRRSFFIYHIHIMLLMDDRDPIQRLCESEATVNVDSSFLFEQS